VESKPHLWQRPRRPASGPTKALSAVLDQLG
jgi:hypothetical protein